MRIEINMTTDTTTKHSPAPWVIRFGSRGQPVSIDAPSEKHIPGAVGGVIRQNGIGLPSSPVALANARLIAAAPVLLAAAKTQLRRLEGRKPPGYPSVEAWARDTINNPSASAQAAADAEAVIALIEAITKAEGH